MDIRIKREPGTVAVKREPNRSHDVQIIRSAGPKRPTLTPKIEPTSSQPKASTSYTYKANYKPRKPYRRKKTKRRTAVSNVRSRNVGNYDRQLSPPDWMVDSPPPQAQMGALSPIINCIQSDVKPTLAPGEEPIPDPDAPLAGPKFIHAVTDHAIDRDTFLVEVKYKLRLEPDKLMRCRNGKMALREYLSEIYSCGGAEWEDLVKKWPHLEDLHY